MVEDDFSKRRTLFTPGKCYRVLRDIKIGRWSFTRGDVVEFISSGYSRYDCSWVFVFRDVCGGENSWFLSDDEPIESAAQSFAAKE